MCLESAIKLQRHHQSKANNDNSSSVPELRTNEDLERHVAKIYTYPNFFRFQDELWVAYMNCEIEDKKEIKEGFLIVVVDSSKKGSDARHVIYNLFDHVVHCSCKMFECEGIPCHHILCIFKAKFYKIPTYYILNRWTKMHQLNPFLMWMAMF